MSSRTKQFQNDLKPQAIPKQKMETISFMSNTPNIEQT